MGVSETTTNVIALPDRALLKAALSYSQRGWHVFPCYEPTPKGCSCKAGERCHHPGKHPRLGNGYEASKDPKEIEAWWKQFPNASIAIQPGPSELVVLDIDPRNDGDSTLAELEREHGQLPKTVTALTGGGGQHYYFRRPPDAIRLKSGILGQGIDLKADTGYVIAPPSVHYTGVLYQWDAGAHFEETPLALLPDWIRLRSERPEYNGLTSSGEPIKGLMGAAFAGSGMLGRRVGSDKVMVQCPWESSHTTGKRYDGSTIVFAPIEGKKRGWFHCSHSHCAERTQSEVLDALSPDAVLAARKQLGIHPDAPIDPQPPPEPEPEAPKPPNPNRWKVSLHFDSKERLTNVPGNLALFLANDSYWKGCLRYDSFRRDIFWQKNPPSIPGFTGPTIGDQFLDHDALIVAHYFARAHGVRFAKNIVHDCVNSAAHADSYDSLLTYLDALEWDGVPRVNHWLTTYMGARDNSTVRWFGRKWLVSAIARAYKPGCQADHVLVLEGPQGTGKDTAARILGGEFLLPDLPRGLEAKDTISKLSGRWIVEVGELSAFRGAEITTIKSFITQVSDVYRKPYERVNIEYPRRCVFVATTNESQYLADPTGARRFWPVKVKKLMRQKLTKDRDQIWAEAKALYQAGETWHPDEDQVSAAKRETDTRQDVDPWEDRIAGWLIRQEEHPNFDPKKGHSSDWVLEKLGFYDGSRIQRRAGHRLQRVMRNLGYERKRVEVVEGSGRKVSRWLSYETILNEAED